MLLSVLGRNDSNTGVLDLAACQAVESRGTSRGDQLGLSDDSRGLGLAIAAVGLARLRLRDLSALAEGRESGGGLASTLLGTGSKGFSGGGRRQAAVATTVVVGSRV